MLIMGHEIPDLDTFNPDVVEQIENAKEKVVSECIRAGKEKKMSVGLRIQCEAIAEFIDTLWGKGKAAEIFGETVNLRVCLNAYEEINAGLDADTKKQTIELSKLAEKYSPKRANRSK